MKRIKLYKTYIFDVLNTLNLREQGTYTVQVLEKKRRFLAKSVYLCISLQTGQLINCTSNLLTPLPEGLTVESYAVTRYPEDIPVINDRDLYVVNTLMNGAKQMNINDEPLYRDLHKLKIKLDYYSKVRDV